ncbi:hypothetical protein QYE76_049493 [Lolium multiflorum]|uniref:Uncharacterized protein n=1 Tax=Lolium multiflorum TaxID=4521 RepID=A0AAD8SPF0_LOLMU|nr:hypothetical protein QYE76_049493 [Lolium multiflorum]
MDMAFGKFHFRVGKEGSHRLARSDSARSDAAGSGSSGSISSFESSDEEVSSAISTKLASSGELIKIFSNISVGSFADSNISSDSDSVDAFDFIDRSTIVGEVFTDLYDGVTDPDKVQRFDVSRVFIDGGSSLNLIFVARLGQKALPFYALIKQGEKFEWNEETDRAFEDLKRTISTPPILVAPKEKEPILLYIAATPQVVRTVMRVRHTSVGNPKRKV